MSRIRTCHYDWHAVTTYYDPADMALRGRLGGLKRASLYDGLEMTQKARDVYRASFLEGHDCTMCGRIDIPAELPQRERARRAEKLREFHFAQLAYRSAMARRRKAAA